MSIKNPLPMRGTIDRCWLFTFQSPADEIRALLPSHVELVTHHGCGFYNAVVCHVSRMRPHPLPALVGKSYWHVAYRTYVRFYAESGETIEGLYFFRSDCDSKLMTWGGNLLTDFCFHNAGIEVVEDDNRVEISVDAAGAAVDVAMDRNRAPQVPADSVFASLEEAAAFLKYHPAGIAVDDAGNANVVHINRNEADWKYRLVTVTESCWEFFSGSSARPEICYEVEPIVYLWNRGRRYRARDAAAAGKEKTPT